MRRDMRFTTALSAASVASAALIACAGPQRPWPRATICEIESRERPPSTDAALNLLLSGWDPTTRRATRPALDCTSAQVRWDAPAFACSDTALASKVLGDQPLVADDVVVTPAGEGAWLVWAITNRLATGDAIGPVAAVESRRSSLQVKAIGTLRAYPRHARLRIERLGMAHLLVAEGDLCSGDGGNCTRAARLMLLAGNQFKPVTLGDHHGGCSGPGWIDLQRVEVVRRGESYRRKELTASLVFEEAALRVDELVVVQDLGTKPGASPARQIHGAQASRTVTLVDGSLKANDGSLWARMERE